MMIAPGRTFRRTSATIVPVPGGHDDHLVLIGLSPNLEQQGEVLDLFDAIAGTFRFVVDDRDEAEGGADLVGTEPSA